jgi:hypothetical protein
MGDSGWMNPYNSELYKKENVPDMLEYIALSPT